MTRNRVASPISLFPVCPISGDVGGLVVGRWLCAMAYTPLTAEGAVGRMESCYRSAKVNPTADSIFDLSPSEKLQIVEDLWDDLAANAGDIPVHDCQKEELARRQANLTKNPGSGLTWEEVKRRIRNRHGR